MQKLTVVYSIALLILVARNGTASELSEQQQLDLLEAADRYYQSTPRDNAHSIQLYEQVLANVDLADPIRRDTLFKVGGMLLYDRLDQPSETELIRALDVFDDLIEVNSEVDWRVLLSSMYIGDIWYRLGDSQLAAQQYLTVRELFRDIPPEEIETLPKIAHDLPDTALRNLIQAHERRGTDAIPDLEALAEAQADDVEVANAALEAVARLTGDALQETANPETAPLQSDADNAVAVPAMNESAPQEDTAIAEVEGKRSLRAVTYPGPFYEIEQKEQRLAPVYWVRRALQEAYEIPICFEGHPVLGRRTSNDFIPFRIQRNETLRHAVDKYEALMDGAYQWKWIRGVPYIGPPLDEYGRAGTSFDAIVSLELESASVWDAFVALAEAIAANNTSDLPFKVVQPQCMATGWLPPEELTEDGVISLSLSNVTAREAACAIVKAAPFEMHFILSTSTDSDHLSLYFTEDGEHIQLQRMTQDDIQLWNEEILAVRARLAALSER